LRNILQSEIGEPREQFLHRIGGVLSEFAVLVGHLFNLAALEFQALEDFRKIPIAQIARVDNEPLYLKQVDRFAVFQEAAKSLRDSV
jgi:hypothetical protein